jgi:uncharacterized protein YbaR (Trm112 family)
MTRRQAQPNSALLAGEMGIDEWLLDILACPACHGKLLSNPGNLTCPGCGRIYPVRDEIPILLIDEAAIDRQTASKLLPAADIRPRSAIQSEKSSGLSATYFPWSVITNQQTLKRALLYFDRLYILAPSAPTLELLLEEIDAGKHSSPSLTTSMRNSLRRFYHEIASLRDAGIIETFGSDFIFSDENMKRTLQDMTFDDVVNLDSPPIRDDVEYFWSSISGHTRMLREWDEGTRQLAVQYWTDVGASEAFGAIEDSVNSYLEHLPLQARSLYSRQGVMQTITPSLMSNISILCIERSGSAPLIDSSSDFELFQHKYRRMFSADVNVKAEENRQALTRLVASADSKSGILANYALEVLLPDLSQLSFEDILDIRQRFDESLQAFRLLVSQLAADISATVADVEFYRQCQAAVEKDILPAALELGKEMRLSKARVIKRVMDSAASFKPAVPFVISAFAPLPIYAAALVSAGIMTFDVAMDTYLSRKNRLYNNGVAYILEASGQPIKVDTLLWNRSAAIKSRYGL